MIVEFETKKVKGIFVKVPDNRNNFNIRNSILCSNGADLVEFKDIELPKNDKDWHVLGISNELQQQDVAKLGISLNEYIVLLHNNNITINFSSYTGKWVVLISNKN